MSKCYFDRRSHFSSHSSIPIIRRLFTWFLIAGFFVAAAATGVASTVPFVDTFDDYPSGISLNGTNGWRVSGSGTVTATNGSAQIVNSDTNVAFFNEFDDGELAVSMSFDLQPVYTDGEPTGAFPADATFVFYVDTNGVINAYNGASVTALVHDAVSDQFPTNFQVELDYGISKWSLSVGGVGVASDFAFYSSSHATFSELGFIERGAATSVVDNVDIQHDVGQLNVSVTSPTAGQLFLPGSSVTATVAVVGGEAPYDVTLYVNSAVVWSTSNSSTNLFTIDLGVPADGTYTNYATVTDNLSSNATSATNTFSVEADTNAPTPDPMTFAVEPTSLGSNRVVMTASTATDTRSPPVQYYFVNTTNSDNSGWISGTVWTNTGLTKGTTYGYQVKARDAVSNETAYSAIFNATPSEPILTWDHNADGTASDGGGTWLNANQWLDGGTPVTWNNDIPHNAIIGSGGAGGTITLGAVTAGTVLLDNFTGTYALNGGSLDQSGGVTIGANAGNVAINSDLSGTGGVTVNGPSRVNLRFGSKTYSGDLVINAGEVLEYLMGGLGTGNMTLNGGVMVDYWNGNFNRTLGSGPGQVQILGGESGFCGQGRIGFTVRLNNSDSYVVQWGSTYFNPSVLVLQSPWANTNGKLSWKNPIDLNGAQRIIAVNKDDLGTGGYAALNGIISNSDEDHPAGLTKNGPGILILSAANTYDGATIVNEGTLQVAFANTSNDDADVTIASDGATLELDFADTDTVAQLIIGTTTMDPGVYGVGNIEIPQITGTGTLTVTGRIVPGTAIVIR